MAVERGVRIEVVSDSGVTLDGDLSVPNGAAGVVVFAHGSGSSRHSRRNRAVADHLQKSGFATLLLDLLTAQEEEVDLRTGELRFDVELLAARLAAAADWAGAQGDLEGVPLGYFGASTGAAAALIAAADHPDGVGAIVSRGGRLDLAGRRLPLVRCPTLLVVGGADQVVLDLNRQALGRLRVVSELEIIPGATHLFEERGALDVVADLAARWFVIHLTPAGGGRKEPF